MPRVLRIVAPRRSTIRVVRDSFFNVRTAFLLLVLAYCCLKVFELGDKRTEVSKLLSNIGLQEYEDRFALKGYFSVDDVLLVSTTELMEDIGFETRIMASKVKDGAFRSRRGDFLGLSLYYVVLVFVGFSAAMCILSKNFRKAAAEICVLIILISWSFGRKQYRHFYSIEGVPAEIVVDEDKDDDKDLDGDKGKKHRKMAKVKKKVKGCFKSCFKKSSSEKKDKDSGEGED
ncbi:SAM domain-containing protein [Chloropicon primus]|uniref:SAM domain-containing protein n=1 Tax=Chloropicon primus TaxID=1764295 RepID=A0A5B8MKW4_9CHLO|nr:hypothetical protein A3770_04p32020 [Chloropicon primus]UPQ99896.1 SAM domain-containing protein [Chloropicon primus]|eukprot:QDZ20684.1 hypothetical protein A3770_04p32020 [Chloropicon primus]